MKKRIIILIVSILIIAGAIYYFGRTKANYDSFKLGVQVMGIKRDEWMPMLYLYLSKFMIALSIIGCVLGFNLRYNFKSKMNKSDLKILDKFVDAEEVATVIVVCIQTILIFVMMNFVLTKIALLLMLTEYIILFYPSSFFYLNLVALTKKKKKEIEED